MGGFPDPFGDDKNLLELACGPTFRGLTRHQLTRACIHKETLESDPLVRLMQKNPTWRSASGKSLKITLLAVVQVFLRLLWCSIKAASSVQASRSRAAFIV
jgi:hypothetical protein